MLHVEDVAERAACSTCTCVLRLQICVFIWTFARCIALRSFCTGLGIKNTVNVFLMLSSCGGASGGVSVAR